MPQVGPNVRIPSCLRMGVWVPMPASEIIRSRMVYVKKSDMGEKGMIPEAGTFLVVKPYQTFSTLSGIVVKFVIYICNPPTATGSMRPRKRTQRGQQRPSGCYEDHDKGCCRRVRRRADPAAPTVPVSASSLAELPSGAPPRRGPVIDADCRKLASAAAVGRAKLIPFSV
jgi:hypothetical protein